MSEPAPQAIGGLDKMPEPHYQSLESIEQTYWWHLNRVRLAQSWLRAHCAAQHPALLDLGCGTGGFLAMLAPALGAADAVGVEASPIGIAACRRKGLEVVQEDLAAPFTLDRRFDVATAMDVLEHLPDETPLLESARASLRPGGLLLVSVPAVPWLFSTWDRQLGHHRRYTRERLLEVVAHGGFDVLRCSHAFAYALPPAIVRRLLGRAYTEDSCVFPPVHPLLNGMLKTAGALEAAWLRRRDVPLGLSIYLLARVRRDHSTSAAASQPVVARADTAAPK